MKIIKICTFICLSTWMFSSCQSFLDSRDKSQVLEEKLFVNQEGVEEAIYGLYTECGFPSVWGTQYPIILDCMAQYYTLGDYSKENSGGFENVMLHKHDFKRSLELFHGIWADCYKIISDVNKVLENLDNWDKKPLKHMDLYRGECLGLRAFVHFELLRTFGSPNLDKRGIPYVRNYGMWVTSFSKTGECYDKILEDLKEAQTLLVEDEELLTYPRKSENVYDGFSSYREMHMNLYAVKALLARVYQTRNQGSDLDSALMYARQVVDSKKFPLPANENISPNHFIRMMSGTVAQDEAIFGIYKFNTFAHWQNSFLLKNGAFLPAYKDMYQVLGDNGTDYRSNWLREPFSSNMSHDDELGIRVMKLVNAEAFDKVNADQAPIGEEGLNFIRIPEMYLMLAELLLEKDKTAALGYFNDFIYSRGLGKVKDLDLKAIDEQFWREYIAEGQYWFRLRRQQVSKIMVEPILAKVKRVEYIEMDESKWTIPIPDAELEFRDEETYK